MDTVYVETTVIGSIAGRMHPNPLIAARQQKSRLWWKTASTEHKLLISQLVVDECLAGDPDAAQERVDKLVGIPRLVVTDAARNLANALMNAKAIPQSEPLDSLHVATAAVHGVKHLGLGGTQHFLDRASLPPDKVR